MILAVLSFAGWGSIGRIVLTCAVAFLWMLVLIRFFGKLLPHLRAGPSFPLAARAVLC